MNEEEDTLQQDIDCRYFVPSEFNPHCNKPCSSQFFSFLHCNARSLSKNHENLDILLSSVQHKFSVIGISETWLNIKSPPLFAIEGYTQIRKDRGYGRGGGVLMYVSDNLSFKPRNDLSSICKTAECLCIEVDLPKEKNFIVCLVYRPPSNDVPSFLDDLESLLFTINSSNKSICVMGDFNIDLLNHCQNSLRFQNILDSNAFCTMIDKPSRVSEHSSTLLDNIFVKSTKEYSQSGLFYSEISDHLPVFCLLYNNQASGIRERKLNRKRHITDEKISLLDSDLRLEKWDDVLICEDVEEAYDVFWKKFHYYFDKHFPYEEPKQKRHTSSKPWITEGILRSIKKRNAMYKKSINTPSEENTKQYKKYRNKLTSIIRSSRKLFYSRQLENASGNMSSTWRVIKGILSGKKGISKIPEKIISEGTDITAAEEIANSFNTFFANVGPSQASKINKEGTNFRKYLKDPSEFSLFLEPTDCIEILHIVNELKNSHSCGHDEVSTYLLKKIIGSIITPLVHICNISLLTGVFPSSFKLAKVIPIHKKDDTMVISNYRPISILPAFSKILERVVYDRLYKFLDNNLFLNPEQYGFRQSHSTDLALLKFFDRVSTALAHREHAVGVFMDLSKAFDTLDHSIILSKLQYYGVRGIAYQWFSSYLTRRRQFTYCHSVNSDILFLKCGVPQGSILGPLLFLIYINDICNVSNVLSYTLFADDTTVFYSHHDIQSLEQTMNQELPKLTLWFRSNALSLNVQKTNFMHFKGRKSCHNQSLDIKLDGVSIERRTCTKFLGVFINDKLTWNDHVNHVAIPISRNIGIMYKVKSFVSDKILLMLYNTLILPYISYCNILWATSKSMINIILLLQKKAVRICTRSGFRDHTEPLFARLKCLKVDDINLMQTALFMFRFNTNLLPMPLSHMFQPNSAVHSYSTRQALDIHLQNPRTALAHKSIRHRGPDVWNSLPQNVRCKQKLVSFKGAIKHILLSHM